MLPNAERCTHACPDSNKLWFYYFPVCVQWVDAWWACTRFISLTPIRTQRERTITQQQQQQQKKHPSKPKLERKSISLLLTIPFNNPIQFEYEHQESSISRLSTRSPSYTAQNTHTYTENIQSISRNPIARRSIPHSRCIQRNQSGKSMNV